MVAAKTSADLLRRVRRKMLLSDNDPRASDTDILEEADEWLSSTIAHLIITARNERWVTQAIDVPLQTGVNLYPVPPRALAAGVAEVLLLDSQSDGELERNMVEIPAHERYVYLRRRGSFRAPFAYCWEGDNIVILPTPMGAGVGNGLFSIRVRFPAHPGRLVPIASCGKITSIAAGNIVIDTALPLSNGDLIDVVPSEPHGFIKRFDVPVDSVAGGGTTFTVEDDSRIAVGDYVSLAGQTCVVPVPEAVFAVLVVEVALGLLATIGHTERIAELSAEHAAKRLAVKGLLEPRNRGQNKKIINRYSSARGGRHQRWLW